MKSFLQFLKEDSTLEVPIAKRDSIRKKGERKLTPDARSQSQAVDNTERTDDDQYLVAIYRQSGTIRYPEIRRAQNVTKERYQQIVASEDSIKEFIVNRIPSLRKMGRIVHAGSNESLWYLAIRHRKASSKEHLPNDILKNSSEYTDSGTDIWAFLPTENVLVKIIAGGNRVTSHLIDDEGAAKIGFAFFDDTGAFAGHAIKDNLSFFFYWSLFKAATEVTKGKEKSKISLFSSFRDVAINYINKYFKNSRDYYVRIDILLNNTVYPFAKYECKNVSGKYSFYRMDDPRTKELQNHHAEYSFGELPANQYKQKSIQTELV